MSLRHYLLPVLTFSGAMMLSAATPAFAQADGYITAPPPPLRYQVQPPSPGDGYAWTDGYWASQGGQYAWVPGVWVQPPYAGAYWTHPHYDHYDEGWNFNPGYWGREDRRDARHEWRHPGV